MLLLRDGTEAATMTWTDNAHSVNSRCRTQVFILSAVST